MSKTVHHYEGAAEHHERAAYQFKEAAKYHETEEHEKAAHHAYLAHGHARHAIFHELAAAKLHVEGRDDLLRSNPSQTAKKTSAA